MSFKLAAPAAKEPPAPGGAAEEELMLTLEQKIARARVAGLVRAVAAAENRGALARAKGKDAGPAEREAAALRDELERVEALAEGRETAAPPPPPLAPTPEEDAGAAAEDVIQRAASPAGRRHVEALRQALAEEGAAVHLDPPPPRRRLAVMPPLFLPPSWGRPWTPS